MLNVDLRFLIVRDRLVVERREDRKRIEFGTIKAGAVGFPLTMEAGGFTAQPKTAQEFADKLAFAFSIGAVAVTIATLAAPE